jgi:hypothetical protein
LTRPRCVQVKCDTPLQNSQGELQVCLDLIPIKGWSKELWAAKVLGVQIGTISRLLLGSPRKKCHLNVGATEQRRKYYMGEGGGFPWVQAVVNLVSLKSPVACPSTKGAPESELTNLWLVGCIFKWVIEKLVTLPSPIPEP